MGNLAVIAILLCIIGGSIAKIVSEKRKGVKCIGCPHGGNHSKKTVTQINLTKKNDHCDC